ncbi:hypothetical protein [Comamonas sp. lk]|uniref:tetratricopeptide repeat protein n=1 Tax=Comamonas sp. lk TaxID=2201272 RepID=UPI000EB07D17|nr:hypothetical protein [Comamonas sp. lk]
MRKNHSTLVLPAVAVITTLLTGCAGLGLGKSEPMLSPAAKAAAEMPTAKDPVINTEETYAALVQQMQAKSLWFASLAHLDAMDRQWGVTTESRLLRADALRNVGQLSASTALYQGLLGTARDGAARYGLGRVAAEKGDFRSAAQQMEQARLSNPVDPQLLTDLGYAYLQARDLGAARMPLMQAAQLNPEDAQANVNLSLFLMINGQNQEAELLMKQRKLDAQTQLAVKQQATQWLQESAKAPKPQASAPAVEAKPSTMAVQSAKPVIAEQAAQAAAVAVQSAAALAPAIPAPAQSIQAAPAVPAAQETRWMVSDTRFDSARPGRPGSEVQAVAAYAPSSALAAARPDLSPAIASIAAPMVHSAEAAVQSSAAPTVLVVSATVEVAVPKSVATLVQPAHKPDAPAVSSRAAPVLTAAPASPVALQAKSLGQGIRSLKTADEPAAASVVVASSGVRQVAAAASQAQSVQAIVPRRAVAGGLFFETPDEPQERNIQQAAALPRERLAEKAWP